MDIARSLRKLRWQSIVVIAIGAGLMAVGVGILWIAESNHPRTGGSSHSSFTLTRPINGVVVRGKCQPTDATSELLLRPDELDADMNSRGLRERFLPDACGNGRLRLEVGAGPVPSIGDHVTGSRNTLTNTVRLNGDTATTTFDFGGSKSEGSWLLLLLGRLGGGLAFFVGLWMVPNHARSLRRLSQPGWEPATLSLPVVDDAESFDLDAFEQRNHTTFAEGGSAEQRSAEEMGEAEYAWRLATAREQWLVIPVGSERLTNRFRDGHQVLVQRRGTEVMIADTKSGAIVPALATLSDPLHTWTGSSLADELRRTQRFARVSFAIACVGLVGIPGAFSSGAAWLHASPQVAVPVTSITVVSLVLAIRRSLQLGAARVGESLVISNFWRTRTIPIAEVESFEAAKSVGGTEVAAAVLSSGRVHRITAIGLPMSRGTERLLALNTALAAIHDSAPPPWEPAVRWE